MIAGIGTDVIEVSRIEKQLEQKSGAAFRDKLYTQGEIQYCEPKVRRAQHYAARFAAKESFFKALGTGWSDGLAWTDVEIVHDPRGRPQVTVHGKAREMIEARGISNILVSLSHIEDTASAVVVLES